MNNALEILDWDSTFFGYRIGKIKAFQISTEQLSEIIIKAKEEGTKLLYLFTDPADTASANAADSNKAKLVDQKITFHIKITSSLASEVNKEIKELEAGYPSKQLISLSIQSGLHSRYKIDEGFKNNEFEKLYLAWIENSVSKKIADHTLVFTENGMEQGFVTVKIKDTYGEIGLIAVDENSRGKAIGSKLITAVINLLYQKKISDLVVATQRENIGAYNFYKKAGFTEFKTENIYHIWL